MSQGPYQTGPLPPPYPQGPPPAGYGPMPTPMQGYPLYPPLPQMPPPVPAQRRQGVARVVLVSIVTSLVVCALFHAILWLALGDRLRGAPVPRGVQRGLPSSPVASYPGGVGAPEPPPALGRPVPDLMGLAPGPARQALRSAGLRLAVAGEELSRTGAPGTVLRQTPAAGEVAPAGAEVRVFVAAAPLPAPAAPPSAGSAPPVPARPGSAGAARAAPLASAARPAATLLPDVRRLPLPRARGVLERGGWRVEVQYLAYDEDVSPLRVMRQTPAGGTPAPRGAQVTLVVNPRGD